MKLRKYWPILLLCAGIMAACTFPGDPDIQTEPPFLFTPEIRPTLLTPPPLESLRAPEVDDVSLITIYPQAQRRYRDGRDLHFWPDGNIGFIPLGDQYRFFAANGSRIGRTVGTLDNPAALVEADGQTIVGVSSEFSYAAGGPIYRDPASGMLLMFYHAERHFGGSGFPFHAAIGLASSTDDGVTFNNLGIILETNATPDAAARCCADVGGAAFAIKDGWFYLYFRDRMADLTEINLAVMTAPVDEVVTAARAGRTSEWFKHSTGGLEPSLGGLSSPLEIGNPQTSWFSVSYNTTLDTFIMAITRSGFLGDPSEIYLIASEDGFVWSPRVELLRCDCEMTYPTIIDPGGDPHQTGNSFYVYYASTPSTASFRWEDTSLERLTVSLTGRLVEMPSAWEFNSDPEGWQAINQIGGFAVSGGTLVIDPTSNDPYMHSPALGLSTDLLGTIEIRMRTSASGTGQFFFTATGAPGISESHSVRFPIRGSGSFETYTVRMSGVAGWDGYLGMLRFDPTDQLARVEIDYIRLMP